MMFWKSKQDPSKALQQLSDLMTLIEKRIASLEIEVDSLKLRMKKKMFPKSGDDEEPETGSTFNDGFDSLRKLNKQ